MLNEILKQVLMFIFILIQNEPKNQDFDFRRTITILRAKKIK